ncbi:MAG TPA: hypothetical protein VGY56_20650 [Verrucomicrobiae bacterium]|nr:hypothetical protein [Verrucomicrobiae bacterium]
MTNQRAKTNKVADGKASMSQTQAARVLHVSREHLNRVLNGKVKSRRLLALYNDLIDRQTTKPTTHEKTNRTFGAYPSR